MRKNDPGMMATYPVKRLVLMIEVGRVCVKIAGRDAGKKCVIIDNIDNSFVMIDGETRRRKCNIAHLEPLNKTVKLSKNASHDSVKKVFKEMGIELEDTKPKDAAPRKKRQKITKRQSSESKKGKSSKAKGKKSDSAKKKAEKSKSGESTKKSSSE